MYNAITVGWVTYQGLNLSRDPLTGIITKTGRDAKGRFTRVPMNTGGLPAWMPQEGVPDDGPVDHAFEAECALAAGADRSEGGYN